MVLSKAHDAAFWDKVRTSEAYQPFREELDTMWKAECEVPVPACRYSEFILYNETGSRKEYEKSYFQRRRQMNVSALLAMIYPDEERYLAYLTDVMWAILDEYVWVLPAHMPSFMENVVEHIDLFASETGFALAEIDSILGDRLPVLIRSRIRYEIDRRILQAYLHHTYWWETCTNNWAAVCLNGVVGAFLYQRPDLVESLMPRIQKTIDGFLSGFSEDGTCLEGFGYWHYGFGFFTCLGDLLYDFTEGKTNVFADPKVKTIAGFAQKMFLDGNKTVSFSDGSISGRYHIGLMHYLKKIYPDTITIPPREFSYTNDSCGRWCLHLRALLWFDASLDTAELKQNRTDYLKNAGWMIKVTPNYSFAAKGGTNNEPHNHNDLGSFLIVKNQKQILTDPGSGTYNREYFGKNRYRDFRASSRGHCVPIINGQNQSAGNTRTASTSYKDGVFTVEFAKGYAIPELISLRRVFCLTDDAIRLHDEYEYDGIPETFVERFVSTVQPEITEENIRLNGLLLCPDRKWIQKITVNEEVYENQCYYCIDFLLKSDTRVFEMDILC